MDRNGEPPRLGKLHQGRRKPSPCEIPQAVHRHPSGQQRHDRRDERSAVALDRALEFQPLPHRHDRHSMAADIAAQDHGIALLDRRGPDAEPVVDRADTGGRHIEPVALPPLDNLGVARHDDDPRLRCRLGHRRRHPPEGVHRQSLLQYESCAHPKWPGTAHRKVVYGAVDGDLADVSSWEKERADHVGIGRKGQARAAHRDNGAIVAALQRRVGKRLAEDPIDQFLGEPASPAVADRDFGATGDRQGTLQRTVVHG